MDKMKISRFQKYSPTFSFQSLQIMNIVTISINIAVWFLAFLHFFFKFESIIQKFAVWFASVRRISVSGPKMRAIQGPEPAIRRADIRGTLLPVLTNGGRDAPAPIPDVMKNFSSGGRISALRIAGSDLYSKRSHKADSKIIARWKNISNAVLWLAKSLE